MKRISINLREKFAYDKTGCKSKDRRTDNTMSKLKTDKTTNNGPLSTKRNLMILHTNPTMGEGGEQFLLWIIVSTEGYWLFSNLSTGDHCYVYKPIKYNSLILQLQVIRTKLKKNNCNMKSTCSVNILCIIVLLKTVRKFYKYVFYCSNKNHCTKHSQCRSNYRCT